MQQPFVQLWRLVEEFTTAQFTRNSNVENIAEQFFVELVRQPSMPLYSYAPSVEYMINCASNFIQQNPTNDGLTKSFLCGIIFLLDHSKHGLMHNVFYKITLNPMQNLFKTCCVIINAHQDNQILEQCCQAFTLLLRASAIQIESYAPYYEEMVAKVIGSCLIVDDTLYYEEHLATRKNRLSLLSFIGTETQLGTYFSLTHDSTWIEREVHISFLVPTDISTDQSAIESLITIMENWRDINTSIHPLLVCATFYALSRFNPSKIMSTLVSWAKIMIKSNNVTIARSAMKVFSNILSDLSVKYAFYSYAGDILNTCSREIVQHDTNLEVLLHILKSLTESLYINCVDFEHRISTLACLDVVLHHVKEIGATNVVDNIFLCLVVNSDVTKHLVHTSSFISYALEYKHLEQAQNFLVLMRDYIYCNKLTTQQIAEIKECVHVGIGRVSLLFVNLFARDLQLSKIVDEDVRSFVENLWVRAIKYIYITKQSRDIVLMTDIYQTLASLFKNYIAQNTEMLENFTRTHLAAAIRLISQDISLGVAANEIFAQLCIVYPECMLPLFIERGCEVLIYSMDPNNNEYLDALNMMIDTIAAKELVFNVASLGNFSLIPETQKQNIFWKKFKTIYNIIALKYEASVQNENNN